jgi:transcription termination/antitermination protein NusG
MVEQHVEQKKQWYVLHVRASFEKQVAQALRERIRLEDLSEKFGDIIIPTEKVIETYKGQKRQVSRKFFPTYLLVNMEMTETAWYLVRKTPNVLGFLGGTKPVALSAKEATNIFERIQESAEKPKPKVLFEPGQMVRIIEGPFADFEGVVKAVDYDKKNRLEVSVFVFGRATPVELEFFQVEKTQA